MEFYTEGAKSQYPYVGLKGAGGGLFEISLEIDFMSVSNKGE